MKNLKYNRIVGLVGVLVCAFLCDVTGAPAIDHTDVKIYADRSFSTGWTHIVNTHNGTLWYNAQTGAATIGRFDGGGNYTTLNTMNFSPGWTQIVSTPNGILWYNAQTGAATIGRFDGGGNYTTLKTMNFSKGWTSIASSPNGIIYYNSQTGGGVFGKIE